MYDVIVETAQRMLGYMIFLPIFDISSTKRGEQTLPSYTGRKTSGATSAAHWRTGQWRERSANAVDVLVYVALMTQVDRTPPLHYLVLVAASRASGGMAATKCGSEGAIKATGGGVAKASLGRNCGREATSLKVPFQTTGRLELATQRIYSWRQPGVSGAV